MTAPQTHRMRLLATIQQWHSLTLPIGNFFHFELFPDIDFSTWCAVHFIHWETFPDTTREYRARRLIRFTEHKNLKLCPDNQL